jgi:hypothetical protein
MVDYQATLEVMGVVTGEDELSLIWTAAISSGDPDWACRGSRPCTSTIEQHMAIATASGNPMDSAGTYVGIPPGLFPGARLGRPVYRNYLRSCEMNSSCEWHGGC